MRKITIEVNDKTFDRLEKIKRASGYRTWCKLFIGGTLLVCERDPVVLRRRSASLPVDIRVLQVELAR